MSDKERDRDEGGERRADSELEEDEELAEEGKEDKAKGEGERK